MFNAIPFNITSDALKEISEVIKNKNIPQDYFLRVGIKGGGGCSGMSYLIGFDKEQDTDNKYIIDGITIIMEKKHAMYIAGKTVDFEDGANARGFIFKD